MIYIKMNRSLIAILFAMLIAITCTACRPEALPSQLPTAAPTPTEQSTDSAANTPDPQLSSYDYRIDYSIIPAAIMPELTKADKESYFAIIDAFANYETSVTIAETDGIQNLTELLDLCFPVFFANVYDSEFHIDESTVEWSYNADKTMHYKLMEDFENIVLDKLYAVNEGDAKEASPLMRMLVLYSQITQDMQYDYPSQDFFHGECELTENEYMNHTYDALTSERGVCWCYARAYAFLLNHSGIEALTVSCDGGIGHHEWTMFSYDGSWFFADPTWDMGGTLSYFGITAKNRESSGYLLKNMKYFAGGTHPVAPDFTIDDARFSELINGTYGWLMSYKLDIANDIIKLKYQSYDGFGAAKTIEYDLKTCEFKN